MSHSASDATNRPTLAKVEAQPDANTAIAAFVSELQQGWDQRDAAISNRHFAADVAWGSPYGATVHGYDQLHEIHTRLKQQGTGGAASRYEIVRACAVSDDVIVAHVARSALDPEGSPSSPAPRPRARSQKWRSTSWFASMEHGGSLQARTRRSDQAAPSHPMGLAQTWEVDECRPMKLFKAIC